MLQCLNKKDTITENSNGTQFWCFVSCSLAQSLQLSLKIKMVLM